MSSRQVETERTYDLPDDAMTLPDLVAGTGGVVRAATDVGTDQLEATYFDTDDLQLIRHRATLRRRTGGADAGWHLKLSVAGDTRHEIHWPLGDSSDVPADVRTAVTALALDAELHPVVRLSTSRRRRLLADDAGTTLAELSDDRVSATVLDGASGVTVWREVEVELVDGGVTDLDAVEAALQAAGAVRAATSSKLARALAAHPALLGPDRTHSGTSGDVLLGHLSAQVDRMRRADVDLRLEPDGEGVHDLRVQARRLRTALKVFRPLVGEGVGRHLEHELKLLGRVLSPVRDRQVARKLLASRLQTAASDGAERLLSLFDQQDTSAGEVSTSAMRAALTSRRYLRLLKELDALAAGSGLSDLAAEPARPVLFSSLQRALRRLEKDARSVGSAAPGQRTIRLHDLRKSTKSLRYACEVVEPVEGDSAQRLGQRAKRLQTVLGDHLDRLLLAEQLQPLAQAEGLTATDGFLLGALHAELAAEIATGDREQRAALRKVVSHTASGWLRST